jgi:hypothetical protein
MNGLFDPLEQVPLRAASGALSTEDDKMISHDKPIYKIVLMILMLLQKVHCRKQGTYSASRFDLANTCT